MGRLAVLSVFIILVSKVESTCTPKTLDGGTYGLKLTGNATSNGNLAKGDTYAVVTIKCLSTGHTFNNGVRRVPALNTTHIDAEQSIVAQCGADDKWSANVWYEHTSTGVTTTTQRYMYCTPGCHMLSTDDYQVTYPDGLITSEEYSAPVIQNSELYVKLGCRTGYTQAIGDTGYSTLQCKQKVTSGGSGIDVEWSVDEKNRLTCVRGCTDITTKVQYGETTASVSTVADGPAFTAGDVVPFSCKEGFTLIGHSKLTCTGENTWNEGTPECVLKSGGSPALETCYTLIISVLYLLS